MAGACERRRTISSSSKGLIDFVQIVHVARLCHLPKLVQEGRTLWTIPRLTAGDEKLLRVVSHINCEDRMASAAYPVATLENDALNTRLFERRENALHTCMKEVGECSSAGRLVGDVLKGRCR